MSASVARLKAAAALAILLLALAGSLASEQVTLSTIYPAPSGVYTRMITTGATFLARDGGSSVVVGGSGPAGARLDVIGDIRASTDIRALGTVRGASIRATGDVCTDLNGGRCLSAGADFLPGQFCGLYMTNSGNRTTNSVNGSAAEYTVLCKGHNPVSSCPPGFAIFHTYPRAWFDDTVADLWATCVKL